MKEETPVTREAREALNGHRGGVVFLTGLSGAGKSTLATATAGRLHRLGMRVYVLDGDDLRTGLCSDLGFSDADRTENVRRVAEVARLMADAGLIVITALISPFRADRDAARARFAPGEFIEVFVDAPLAVCEARDPKGLYRRARRGELRRFTGIDSPYEPPLAPDLRIDTAGLPPQVAAEGLVAHLARAGLVTEAATSAGAAAHASRPPGRP